jgi:pentatricopeptide repeat protein
VARFGTPTCSTAPHPSLSPITAPPPAASYNTAIKAAGAACRVDEAFSLLRQMGARGVDPTPATFGALLTLASEAGAWGRVAEAWEALQASGLPVHVGCANTYLTALVKLVGLLPAGFAFCCLCRGRCALFGAAPSALGCTSCHAPGPAVRGARASHN